MKAIIFGSKGQDGFYLTKLLEEYHTEVISVNRPISPEDVDISNYNSVAQLIQSSSPDFIFHFAANSTTKHEAIFENEKIISLGTINILEAVKVHSPSTKVFISGSGLQFENHGYPINEKELFAAKDPYSVCRIHSVYAARYFQSLGLKVYIGYFFNHDSPRRTERHLAKKITEFVRNIDQNGKTKLIIGDINVVKEWTFAKDIASAVYTLVNQDEIHEAVIGSGKGYSVKDFLEICFNLVGKDWKDFVLIQEGFVADYQTLVSDPSIIFSLGWSPAVSITELAELMIKGKVE